MNDVLRIARLKIALQRAFLGRAILIFTGCSFFHSILGNTLFPLSNRLFSKFLKISAKCYDNRKDSVGFHNW